MTKNKIISIYSVGFFGVLALLANITYIVFTDYTVANNSWGRVITNGGVQILFLSSIIGALIAVFCLVDSLHDSLNKLEELNR